MTIRLVPAHRRNLQTETLVSVVINTAISGGFAWGLFQGQAWIPLWGGKGIVVDLVPTVFMITLVLTIALTLITRGRLRQDKLPRPAWSRTDLGFIGRLPDALPLRAPALAAVMTIVLVPVSAALLLLTGVAGMKFATFLIFKLVYGAAFALVVTPIILLRALADQPGDSASRQPT